MRSDYEQQQFQQIAGLFDEPAFLRRDRATHGAWTALLNRVEKQRAKWLQIPAMKLGRLAMVSSGFQHAEQFLAEGDAAVLRRLQQELNPQNRRRLPEAKRDKQVLDELVDVIEALSRFNTRWFEFVCGLNYERVNELRTGYNQYYVLEKECALMSAKTAAAGFRPLPMVGRDDVLERYPLLPVPRLRI